MKNFICFIILLFFVLSFFSCEKSPTKSDSEKKFSMQFINKRLLGNGWAILHTADGTQIENAVRVSGDGFADFGDIGSSRVTCTYIDKYEEQGMTVIYITSDFNAPAGDWVLKGYDSYYRGDATVRLEFPTGTYDRYIMGGPGSYRSGSATPGSPIERDLSIYQLDDYNYFTGFASVYQDDGQSGICGWVLNQPFTEGDTNSYTISLTYAMEAKIITTSRPIDYLQIGACRGSLYWYFTQYRWSGYLSPQTTHNILYSSVFPAVKLALRTSFAGLDYSYYYRYNDTTIPDNLQIPNSYISGNYNYSLGQYENIIVTGITDQISANWYYYDINSNTIVNWNIYVPANTNTIYRPYLSQEIINDLGLDLALLEPSALGLIDYDTASNMDDIINMVFKTSAVFTSLYKINYGYAKYF